MLCHVTILRCPRPQRSEEECIAMYMYFDPCESLQCYPRRTQPLSNATAQQDVHNTIGECLQHYRERAACGTYTPCLWQLVAAVQCSGSPPPFMLHSAGASCCHHCLSVSAANLVMCQHTAHSTHNFHTACAACADSSDAVPSTTGS